MVDLFGNTIVQEPALKKKVCKAPVVVAATVEPVGIRRPKGKVADLWLQHKWEPKNGQITHFNAGTGYDLTSQQRRLLNTCFGYILAVNVNTGEVVVHIPKPRMIKAGVDQFYIVPFYDLLPVAVVADFDAAEYRKDYPIQPCPLPTFWNVTSNP